MARSQPAGQRRERRLFEISLEYLRGNGPAPSERDRARASELRAEARSLFMRALEEIDRGAQAARQAVERPPHGQSPGMGGQR